LTPGNDDARVREPLAERHCHRLQVPGVEGDGHGVPGGSVDAGPGGVALCNDHNPVRLSERVASAGHRTTRQKPLAALGVDELDGRDLAVDADWDEEAPVSLP
jgi:hypothetical protein